MHAPGYDRDDPALPHLPGGGLWTRGLFCRAQTLRGLVVQTFPLKLGARVLM